tara:strand:- start:31 stop:1026 length:996 start_codon:yes stop_codon:yes gene_type:complete
MPDAPMDDPKFLAAYAEAAGATPRAPVRDGTIAEAVIRYRASDDFTRGLKASTRSRRQTTLDDIRSRYGSGPIAQLRLKHIQKDLDRFAGHAANNRLRVWRGLCAWAKSAYDLSTDPSDGLTRKKVAKSDGHVPWEAGDVEKFRARWPIGTAERLAFELIFWTGARVSDAVRMGEGNVDRDGWLSFRQEKTGGEVAVPFDRELPDFAEDMASDLALLRQAVDSRPERHMTFLTTRDGHARSQKAVSQWFAEKARAAGVKGKTAHGLRKARAIALVEAEATHHQVGAWTGHESLKEIERYAKKFNRRRVLTRSKQERESSNSARKVPNQAEK